MLFPLEEQTTGSSIIFVPSVSCDDGDIILRSADSVEFCVHRTILRQASLFFEDMLRIPQSPSFDKTEMTIIPMRDDFAIDIDFILSCIYPTTRKLPVLDSLDRIESVLRVAEKWDFSRVFAIMTTNLLDLLRIGSDALHIWTIATQHELDTVRVTAADRLVAGNIPVIPAADAEPLAALKSVDAFQYAALLFQHAAANSTPPLQSTPRGDVAISEGGTEEFGFTHTVPDIDIFSEAEVTSSPKTPLNHVGFVFSIPPPPEVPVIKMTFADGDLIIRSNDGRDFCVHSSIVAQASEWFSTRLKARDASQAMQVIHVPEDAARIDWILESIYPISNTPTLRSIEEITSTFEAAARLRIPRASSILASNLTEMLPTVDPLSAWVLGTGFRQDKPRIAAIKQILRENTQIIRTSGEPPIILRKVTGYDLASLLSQCANLRSRAEGILVDTANLKGCDMGHDSQRFAMAFAGTALGLGIFGENAFSVFTVRQTMDKLSSDCSYCSNINMWERNELQYSIRRMAIRDILDDVR